MTSRLFAVDGVDFVAGYLLVELGEWEAVAFEEADEVVFEVVSLVAPRSGVRRAVRRPGYRVRRVVSSVGGDEPLDLGLVEGSGELLRGQDVGEVDERAARVW